MSDRSKKSRSTTASRRPAGAATRPGGDAQGPAGGGPAGTGDASRGTGDVGTSRVVLTAGSAAVAAKAVVSGSGERATGTRLRWVRWGLVGLAFAGFLIAFYLTVTHYRNIIPPCYGTSGCEEVITSRYAVILGVPLSLVGTVYFALMFYLGIALLTTSRSAVLRAYELLAYAGLLAAICLFLLQALVLKAYCTYCLTTEVIALLMWAGSFLVTSAARKR